jgi:2-dehydro-3-deoxyphosphogluconate aldolase/(4S)-4-hydroxy-2-oxoglutarate aldolase
VAAVTAGLREDLPGPVAEAHIRAGRLVAIVRVPRLTAASAEALTGCLVDAGVRALEFTLDSEGALEAIRVARSVAGDRAAVGAGTVLAPEQVDDAAAHGAHFIVSPDVCPEVIERTVRLGLLSLPGAFTATEVRRAVDCGARMVKLFPAMPTGAAYLRALRGPLPQVAFVPTGGVSTDDMAELFAAGAVAVAVGSSLVSSAEDLVGLRDRAVRAVAAAAR